MRVLLVDNYDSFTWNVADVLARLGAHVDVVRNDAATIDELLAQGHDAIVLSPGPGGPDGAGVSRGLVAAAIERDVPLLGICLGMQCIGDALGARVVRLGTVVHGSATAVVHDGSGIFAGAPQGMAGGRYHSLVVDEATLPPELVATAHTDDGVLMALRHRTARVSGIQFHPESILTPDGPGLLARFLGGGGMMIDARDALRTVIAGGTLDEEQARRVMDQVMGGDVDDATFGAIFATLHARGETVDELVGFARSMRAHVVAASAPEGAVDTCGTGGDGADTFNVSTCAAFVVAGAGGVVAKHGNRAVSSRCGSADVLEALGGRLESTPEQVAESLDAASFAFLFAPAFHPSMRHAAGPRRAMGVRTAFNFLGPITNPAGVRRQVVGVSDPARAPQVAEVLRRLGCERALVVHGSDGLDELTIATTSVVHDVTSDGVRRYEVDPSTYGLELAPIEAIVGGDAARNAEILLGVLDGRPGPTRDVVLLNAAAGILVAGLVDDLAGGVEAARAAIDDGRARAGLDRYVALGAAGAVA